MKKKVATKSRDLHPRFAHDAKPSRDFAATLIVLPRAVIYYFDLIFLSSMLKKITLQNFNLLNYCHHFG